MTDVKHTPGTWKVYNLIHEDHGGQLTPSEIGEYVTKIVKDTRELDGLDHFLFVKANGRAVCLIGNGPKSSANARLITAAPEMYNALKSIENDDCKIPRFLWDLIQVAIAKAEGRS